MSAAQDIPPKQIQLAIDHPIRLRGSFQGSKVVDYRFRGVEGTWLTVAMQSDNPSAHFDLHSPTAAAGVPDEAFSRGSNGDMRFTGRLPRSGLYGIRISLELWDPDLP